MMKDDATNNLHERAEWDALIAEANRKITELRAEIAGKAFGLHDIERWTRDYIAARDSMAKAEPTKLAENGAAFDNWTPEQLTAMHALYEVWLKNRERRYKCCCTIPDDQKHPECAQHGQKDPDYGF